MLLSECFFEEAFLLKFRALKRGETHALIQAFWPNSTISLQDLDEPSYHEYLDYIRSEISQIQHHRSLFAAQNFESTLAIMKVLRGGFDRPCNDVLKVLSSHFLNIDPAAIRRSLELTIRLWLTLNTRSSEILTGAVFAGERAMEWDVNTSLSTLIEEHFVKRAVSPRFKKPGNVDATFTAAYLVNSCGMRLRWTDDISNHLKFDLRKATLTVYRHKICLVNHLNDQEKCPIARDLLAEILDTMNLLFPFGDKETRQLLSREGQTSIYSLGGCGSIREPDLGHYEYFGEALESLIEYFDRQPRTWRQLALDRRNKLEWSAFWVTIMVAVLTMVSIPCNIIQAMYSFKAYQLALDQARKELARQA